MSIEIVKVHADQVERILSSTEGHFLDLKAIEVAPSKLTKTISAFANASGGELYIGIDETESGGVKRRDWRGFADPEAANGHLQIFEQLFPLGQYYSYTFLSSPTNPGLVLQLSVNKTREITKASDGVAYLRRGA
jgi:ATP-dependent DNA helicase RecG